MNLIEKAGLVVIEWYDSLDLNYQCNQCLSPLTLWVRIGRSVISSGYSLRQYNWPSQYKWNIAEIGEGIKHPNI